MFESSFRLSINSCKVHLGSASLWVGRLPHTGHSSFFSCWKVWVYTASFPVYLHSVKGKILLYIM